MSEHVRELKANFIEAEERYREAYRRAVWVERQLLDAPTTQAFDELSVILKDLERLVFELGEKAQIARVAYVQAEMSDRMKKGA